METFNIDFEPIGRRISISGKTDLLTAAQEAGVSLTALCGGIGACKQCKLRSVTGNLSEVQPVEREAFSEKELSQGWRLACETFPQSDLKIEIPPESMRTAQRLQIEGVLRDVALDPAVHLHDISLSPPDLEDLRADWERLTEAVPAEFQTQQDVELPVLRQFSTRMRELNWSGRVALGQGGRVVGILAKGQPYYGLAVDIGTTKIAAFLVDLGTGQAVAKIGAMNPQIAYGEDVVSRIAYANKGSSFEKTLQVRIVSTLNKMVQDLCGMVGIDESLILDLVVVGNTAMHHLFSGLSVWQLGQAPYVPAVRQAIRFPAREIGLKCASGAWVYMPPNIAGYVGSDHVAMLLASGMKAKAGVALALDIGTNTEISLAKDGRLVSCSCASGPAFEGAHIHAGMRAAPGAIERTRFFDGDWHITTIADEPPVGICGSGILDVVAGLLESGQIDATGRFTESTYRRVAHEKNGAIVLVPEEASGTAKEILVTRADIREIQLAKAAIHAGVEALMRATSTKPDDIVHFIIAGAFGTYLNLDSALRIGMFPELPRERYYQIGNAAGAGAMEMLISKSSRIEAEAILDEMSYIELTTDPGFMDSYIDSMGFD